MAVNTQYSRIKHHTSTTSGSFTVPPSEDFTDGSWDKWDLAKSEIGVNEADDTAFLRIGSNVRQIYPQTAAGDVCGIDDGAGGYTYYSSLGAAITAASSGDTIEVFSNITETGANEILLKDGVDINFNGHQYTLNVATTQDAVTDNNSAVTCTLYNGHIKRTGGTASVSNSLALFIDNSASNITLNGMTFETDFGCVCANHGTITGGLFLGNRTTSAYRGLYDTSTARWYNITMRSVYGEFECRGKVYDSYIYSSSDRAVDLIGSEFNNCTIISDGDFALSVQGGNVNNCYIFSSANRAVSRIAGDTYLNNCYIKSNAGFCVFGGAADGIFATNCHIESTANHTIYQGAEFYNCYITSSAAAVTSESQSIFDSCSVVCTWANASGHGIEVGSTSTTKIVNCYIEVASSSANCIGRVSGTPTIQYTNNIYGTTATTPVNASIVQGMTNTPDTYGNIQIG